MGTLYTLDSGLTFRNVSIQKGATVHKAIVRLTAKASLSFPVHNNLQDNVTVMIIGHDVDNSSPASDAMEAESGARTSNCQSWVNISHWTDNTVYDSPDIACVVQEIVDRSGWASGNNLTVFFEEVASTSAGNTNTTRRAYDYGTDPSKAPKLLVYTTLDETASGGVVCGGTSIISTSLSGSGGVVCGGSSILSHDVTTSGGVVCGGLSVVTTDGIYRYAEGGVVCGGEAQVNGSTVIAEGGVVCGGTALLVKIHNVIGSGGVVVNSTRWLYRKLLNVPEGSIGEDFDKFYLPIATKIKANSSSSVMFTSLSGIVLAHEMRDYEPETGRLWCVVKIPLDADNDNQFYLYYGDNS